jgi:hypothetical protein
MTATIPRPIAKQQGVRSPFVKRHDLNRTSRPKIMSLTLKKGAKDLFIILVEFFTLST